MPLFSRAPARGCKPSRFPVHWVLVNDLAIGPAPLASRHLDRLGQEGIKAILSLCAEHEVPPVAGVKQRFVCRRCVLPDHTSDRLPSLEELEIALQLLAGLRDQGPVFVHCLAAMERSPLLCLAWLVQFHGLKPQSALDYMMQVHPGTNPLPGQLALLEMLA